jgi:peptidoglycan/LPS O-acetylase OafA/YrhL
MKSRLYFLDILRIIAVSSIVFFHLGQGYGWKSFLFGGDMIAGMFFIGLGPIAVSILIFVSGASLEYSNAAIERGKQYADFLIKRLIRLYPAFWIACIIAMIYYNPTGATIPLNYLIIDFSGFPAFFGQWGGSILGGAWFIGLIVCLYLLYPLISGSLKTKYWIWLMFFYATITFGTRFVITGNPSIFVHFNNIARWLPISYFFIFALGMLVIQKKWYPVFELPESILKPLIYLSNLSFYVFLTHFIFGIDAVTNLPWFFTATIISSIALMEIDQYIQKNLRNALNQNPFFI